MKPDYVITAIYLSLASSKKEHKIQVCLQVKKVCASSSKAHKWVKVFLVFMLCLRNICSGINLLASNKTLKLNNSF